MTFVHGDASTGKNQELEALPGPMDVYSMVKGKYLSAAKEEAQQAAANAVAGAQATDTEFNAAMNEVWTPTKG